LTAAGWLYNEKRRRPIAELLSSDHGAVGGNSGFSSSTRFCGTDAEVVACWLGKQPVLGQV
jgi:hypothetical protein